MIIIEKLNEVYSRIHIDDSAIKKEIEETFSWTEPGYIPNKQYFLYLKKKKMKISLFNPNNSTLPNGLLPDLIKFLKESNYEYKVEGKFSTYNITEDEAKEFIESLGLPKKYQIRDYQLKYFMKCVQSQRMVCISPTNSGKTLIAYLIFRYFNQKTLITVPTTTLVYQMFEDFKEYGYDSESNIHCITAGKEKKSNKILTISTWESIFEQPKQFFNDFKVIIGDEAHTNSARSLQKIMNMMVNTSVRVGMTGTLTKVTLYNKRIQGAFGPIIKYISTDELIKRGFSSKLLIKSICLNHNLDITPIDYETELPFLLNSKERNNFIIKLAELQKFNTFVMFRNVAHGKYLYNEIKKIAKCPVFYVDGKTPLDKRNELRHIIEESEESITVASVVFSTGIDISNIHNIIFSHPSKSRIRILQSIGRGLRKNKNKTRLTLYDLYDRLSPRFINTTYNQYDERQRIYKQEKFEIKNYSINL